MGVEKEDTVAGPLATRGGPGLILEALVLIEVGCNERYSRWHGGRTPDMQLILEQIRAGGARNSGYVLEDRDTKQGVLIDPSYSPDAFVQRCKDQGLRITHIINTHGHLDHTNGNAKAAELTAAPVAAFADSAVIPDVGLSDEQELEVDGLRLQFLHVPGHCPDHLVVYEPSWRILITGDLLFVGKVGGTANDDDARLEWPAFGGCSTGSPTRHSPARARLRDPPQFHDRPGACHEPVSVLPRSSRLHRAQAGLEEGQAAARSQIARSVGP
jgi:glyoxylase-like metal-dependent hydrolase (beta-lactamase superfamily II)